jgi:hypothetical protein
MYKLWTSMLTEMLSQQAEQHRMLSTCQEGFRPQRNTQRQLQLVVNALEDAKLHKQDIFMLWIDFTSAFNTTDHDKLLQIMYDLGYPSIAIENVKGIYNHATTQVMTPFGLTDPLPIERGTIQGDTLSPFLFLCFIEPLLKWLHSGGRGYQFGCLPEGQRLLNHCACPAYADDLAGLTHNVPDLQIQEDKVTLYCAWGGTDVNASKCGATGIMYKLSAAMQHNPTCDVAVDMVKRRLANLTIQGHAVPFKHPDKDPYSYLGVPLTASLNYKEYYCRLIVGKN